MQRLKPYSVQGRANMPYQTLKTKFWPEIQLGFQNGVVTILKHNNGFRNCQNKNIDFALFQTNFLWFYSWKARQINIFIGHSVKCSCLFLTKDSIVH